jgi:FeS assembly protein IscX
MMAGFFCPSPAFHARYNSTHLFACAVGEGKCRHTHHIHIRIIKRTPHMKWKDVQTIAEALYDQHPEVDPKTIRFVDLHNYIVSLEGFDDDHNRGGEKVLEAIQQAWIDEAD